MHRWLCGGALLLLAVSPALPEADAPLDPARLGMSESRLRELFGDALAVRAVESPRSLMEQIREASALREDGAPGKPAAETAATAPVRHAEQVRLVRPVGRGDLRQAEYELFRGQVYRIRWQLSERFERPLMDALVVRATEQLGEPLYDQLLKAELASPRAELRRVGWERGDRALELRQLHPLHGGPVYLSVLDRAAARRIVASRTNALPEPDSTGPWWERSRAEPRGLGPQERASLLEAFSVLLAQLDF